MYEYLEGILTIKNISYIALDVNGIGFKVNISLKTYEKLNSLGEKEKLFIYTNVKEDEISFFGFKDELEREIFLKCLSINGIGSKKALAILSLFEIPELVNIIKTKDAKMLSKVPGIGMKKAEMIIIDLKDKIEGINISNVDESILEIINKKESLKLALLSLGYDKFDVLALVNEEELKNLSMQELIKISLTRISKKK